MQNSITEEYRYSYMKRKKKVIKCIYHEYNNDNFPEDNPLNGMCY